MRGRERGFSGVINWTSPHRQTAATAGAAKQLIGREFTSDDELRSRNSSGAYLSMTEPLPPLTTNPVLTNMYKGPLVCCAETLKAYLPALNYTFEKSREIIPIFASGA